MQSNPQRIEVWVRQLVCDYNGEVVLASLTWGFQDTLALLDVRTGNNTLLALCKFSAWSPDGNSGLMRTTGKYRTSPTALMACLQHAHICRLVAMDFKSMPD